MKKHSIKNMSRDDLIFSGVTKLFLVIMVAITFYPVYFVVIASFSDPIYVNNGTFSGTELLFLVSCILEPVWHIPTVQTADILYLLHAFLYPFIFPAISHPR